MPHRLIRNTENLCNDCHIRGNSIFCLLDQTDIASFQLNKSHIFYHAGDTIFSEGSTPNGFYIVYHGQVKIYKRSTIDGKEKIVRFAASGDLVGYRSMLADEDYSASATALTDSYLCYIPRNLLKEIITQYPDIALKLMKLLADDVRQAEENATIQRDFSVKDRLVHAILQLIQINGFQDDGITINISLSREEMAGICNTTRESLTRALGELNDKGLILVKGRNIQVSDNEKLKTLLPSFV